MEGQGEKEGRGEGRAGVTGKAGGKEGQGRKGLGANTSYIRKGFFLKEGNARIFSHV